MLNLQQALTQPCPNCCAAHFAGYEWTSVYLASSPSAVWQCSCAVKCSTQWSCELPQLPHMWRQTLMYCQWLHFISHHWIPPWRRVLIATSGAFWNEECDTKTPAALITLLSSTKAKFNPLSNAICHMLKHFVVNQPMRVGVIPILSSFHKGALLYISVCREFCSSARSGTDARRETSSLSSVHVGKALWAESKRMETHTLVLKCMIHLHKLHKICKCMGDC